MQIVEKIFLTSYLYDKRLDFIEHLTHEPRDEFYLRFQKRFVSPTVHLTFSIGSRGVSHQLFCYTSKLKKKKKKKKNQELVCFAPARSQILPRFKGARPDHVRVESSSCYFPWE